MRIFSCLFRSHLLLHKMMDISHGDQSFYLHFQGAFLSVMIVIKMKVTKPIRISLCSCHFYCEEGIAQ
jgi:hypothetical protein